MTSFVRAKEASLTLGTSAVLGTIRLGTCGGTFLFVGDIVNAAISTTADGSIQRGDTRAFLAIV